MTKIFKTMALCLTMVATSLAANAADKPNILVIWGDDIGWFNVSAYNMGMMGYRTPNIDRIAKEGIAFTDAYGEQSCTAGRSAFITGQSPIRTGLTKVGIPGAPNGIQPEDPTLAELLKPHGYVTGQFGKNHLGDRDEFLPTNHGFDEFFGNLYHLNAEEEPESPNYPKDPRFHERFGPRGVIHSYADGRIEDSGALTRKRMETIDDEFLAGALKFMDKAAADDKPFFLWFNSTRMHIWTHLKEESQGKTGYGIYADGMREHDDHVGRLLDNLDKLGLSENTIVVYSTDNGAEVFSWPDGGMIPFKGEKNTTWEGGFRVPMMVRWPGKIRAGQMVNDMISHMDWVPTIMAAVGEGNIKQDLLDGHTAGDKTFKVHLDGYNFLPFLTGKEEKGPRSEFFYFTDDGDLSALRQGDFKIQFSQQHAHGFDVWRKPLEPLRLPIITNLRMDPFERAKDESIGWSRWMIENIFVMYAAQAKTFEFLQSFKTFPPRQRAATYSIDQISEMFLKAK